MPILHRTEEKKRQFKYHCSSAVAKIMILSRTYTENKTIARVTGQFRSNRCLCLSVKQYTPQRKLIKEGHGFVIKILVQCISSKVSENLPIEIYTQPLWSHVDTAIQQCLREKIFALQLNCNCIIILQIIRRE